MNIFKDVTSNFINDKHITKKNKKYLQEKDQKISSVKLFQIDKND